jgi:serine/threonine protein kinase
VLTTFDAQVTFDDDTGEVIAKVCDFGLSRRLEEQQRPTQMQGTPYWTAPEGMGFIAPTLVGISLTLFGSVICGEDYTFTADIYSFGIMLWELCARRLPYSDVDRAYSTTGHNARLLTEIVSQHRRPLMPAELAGTPIGDLIAQCWHTEPLKRPSLAQLEHELKSLSEAITETMLVHPAEGCSCRGRIGSAARSSLPVSSFRDLSARQASSRPS